MSARPWRAEQMFPMVLGAPGPWVRIREYGSQSAAENGINRLRRGRVQTQWQYRIVNRDTAEVIYP